MENSQKVVLDKLKKLDDQINELKSRTLKDSSCKDQLDAVIEKLEKIRDDLRKRYDDAVASGREDWNEFDKNIFQDTKSFDTAFKQAGSLFTSGSETIE